MEENKLFQVKSNTLDVKTGNILISEPFLNDLFFGRSVILIVDNNQETGCFGVIINKLLSLKINDILENFPVFDAPVFLGGPVSTDCVFFVHTLENIIPDSVTIRSGLYWSGNIYAVKRLIKAGLITKHDIRFFIGYSGWDAGQLENELKRNSWIVCNIPNSLIIKTNPVNMWNDFSKKAGDRYRLWSTFPINPNEN